MHGCQSWKLTRHFLRHAASTTTILSDMHLLPSTGGSCDSTLSLASCGSTAFDEPSRPSNMSTMDEQRSAGTLVIRHFLGWTSSKLAVRIKNSRGQNRTSSDHTRLPEHSLTKALEPATTMSRHLLVSKSASQPRQDHLQSLGELPSSHTGRTTSLSLPPSFVPPSGLAQRRSTCRTSSTAGSISSFDSYLTISTLATTTTSFACSDDASSLRRRNADERREESTPSPTQADIYFCFGDESHSTAVCEMPELSSVVLAGGSRGGRGSVFLLPPYVVSPPTVDAPTPPVTLSRRALRVLARFVLPHRSCR